jgi:hypothetical protein
MMLRRPVGGKAAVELAREAALCEAAVPLSCSFVPKHAVLRALDKAFSCALVRWVRPARRARTEFIHSGPAPVGSNLVHPGRLYGGV